MSEFMVEGTGSNETTNNLADDTAIVASGNRSIMGKVKSHVSNIIPTTLSKWFSPAPKTTPTDAVNGDSVPSAAVVPLKRRRCRRIEIEFDEDDDDGDVDGGDTGEVANYNQADLADNIAEHDAEDNNMPTRRGHYYQNNLESSSGEFTSATGAVTSRNNRAALNSRKILESSALYTKDSTRLPKPKRPCMSTDGSARDNAEYDGGRPLVASTPSLGAVNLRNSASHPPTGIGSSSRNYANRYSYLNLYGHQSKREPAYNFSGATAEPALATSGDLPATTDTNVAHTGLSSRRTLNIPLLDRHTNLPNFKRQCLSSVRATGTMGSELMRTSTTIAETVGEGGRESIVGRSEHLYGDVYKNGPTTTVNNNNIHDKSSTTDTRGKVFNGVEISDNTGPIDTASEISRDDNEAVGNIGLSNKDNSSRSRTSSIGNSLNFYSHLQGRKSLFSGTQPHPPQQQNSNLIERLSDFNNSTLSLNSLNRRQFNASIYGSTSALSDSRLLNTFSPFYKGRTTYGGASAYNKYNTTLSTASTTTRGKGAGASFLRLQPTVIRPTSSLSTSSNSLSSVNATAAGTGSGDTVPIHISDTAQKILELLNDFSSPLGDAKKMASNLKERQQQTKSSSRLQESDLRTSRLLRTPYARPTPPLQNGYELKLQKLRSFHVTTENLRKIAMPGKTLNPSSTVVRSDDAYEAPEKESHQLKHTNKIRSKITTNVRASVCKDGTEDEAPPPINLPSIAFPTMQSVPKFDIQLPKPSLIASKPLPTIDLTKEKETIHSPPPINFAFKPVPMTAVPVSNFVIATKPDSKFQFEAPVVVVKNFTNFMPTITNNFTFKAPIIIKAKSVSSASAAAVIATTSKSGASKLKTGSVLDVLFPKTSASKTVDSSCTIGFGKDKEPAKDIGFGVQFSKSKSEWECDTCMVRNKQDAVKCVACESPCPLKIPRPVESFAEKFKLSKLEWECDACMLRNKNDAMRCVACETGRPGMKSSKSAAANTLNKVADVFAGTSKSITVNTWECSGCKVVNNNSDNECKACQNKKPTEASVASTFKFGFDAAKPTSNATIAPAQDDVMKKLAETQKQSKWGCAACFAQNDSNRNKCICCEEPKPGTLTSAASSTTKFSFGQSSATKFKFGFAKDDGASENTTANTTSPANTGFIFGNSKPLTTSSSNTTVNAAQKQASTISTTTGFTFGVNSPKSENKPTQKTVTFKLPEDSAASSTETDSSSKDNAPQSFISTTTGFTFGFNSPKSENKPTQKTVTFKLPENSDASSSETDSSSKDNTTTFSFGLAASKPITTSNVTTETIKTNTTATAETSLPAAATALAPSAETKASLWSIGTDTTKLKTTTATTTASVPSYSFGTKDSLSGTTSVASTMSNTTFSPPKATFSFGSFAGSAVSTTSSNGAATVSTVSSIPLKAAAAATTTAATVAPVSTFIFGQPTASTTLTKATAPASTFSFGQTANLVTPATATTQSLNPPTTATTQSLNPPTTAASIFGSSNITAAPVSSAATSSSTFIFGSVAPNQASQVNNATSTTFGAFGTTDKMPATATTFFGQAAASTVSSSSGGSQSSVITSTAATSSKGNMFGNVSGNTGITSAFGINNNLPTVPSVFGTVTPTVSSSSSSKTTSVFGASTFGITSTVSGTAATPTATFSVPSSSSNMFGNIGGIKPAAAVTSSNTFGGFGNQPATNISNITQTTFGGFGAATPTAPIPSATVPTFGGFGVANAAAVPTPAAAAAAKPAFNFGGGAAATIQNSTSSSGVFSFGATNAAATFPGANNAPATFPGANNAPKPGFNFTTTSPTVNFNFTGTQATAQTSNTNANIEARAASTPFHFGAALTPAAPVFNFIAGGSQAEATNPSAPFQFNAGAATPANIFAINPAASGSQNSQQQARRKVRAPTRRLTPR